MPQEFIFVYGTLRKQHGVDAYRALASYCDFFAEGRLNGKLFEVNGYPGAVESDNPSEIVVGELYLINSREELLSALDEYEECNDDFPQPHEYIRKKLPVYLMDGKVVSAWVYVYNRATDVLEQIEPGDYLQYDGLKRL